MHCLGRRLATPARQGTLQTPGRQSTDGQEAVWRPPDTGLDPCLDSLSSMDLRRTLL
eukprot:NODE_5390_length_710_cov_11.467474_g4538_i0.p4 GENE.NODE_5390_length_710_cov_11.467474_g4538_i0~~NODE_5390_length_710_cov_11.467474_g4538_i0.p4  ORF type:complete len:57 (+),score=0.39 NODE_5390_length_710_cov_11.467474_g4538_i0:148-318(+)